MLYLGVWRAHTHPKQSTLPVTGVNTCTHAHTHTLTDRHTHSLTHTLTHTHSRTNTYTHAHTHTHTHAHTHKRTHTHTHTHTRLLCTGWLPTTLALPHKLRCTVPTTLISVVLRMAVAPVFCGSQRLGTRSPLPPPHPTPPFPGGGGGGGDESLASPPCPHSS